MARAGFKPLIAWLRAKYHYHCVAIEANNQDTRISVVIGVISSLSQVFELEVYLVRRMVLHSRGHGFKFRQGHRISDFLNTKIISPVEFKMRGHKYRNREKASKNEQNKQHDCEERASVVEIVGEQADDKCEPESTEPEKQHNAGWQRVPQWPCHIAHLNTDLVFFVPTARIR